MAERKYKAKIDKGISPDRKAINASAQQEYLNWPYTGMSVTDSFLVPVDDPNLLPIVLQGMMIISRQYGRRSQKVFQVMKVAGGIRVWRNS